MKKKLKKVKNLNTYVSGNADEWDDTPFRHNALLSVIHNPELISDEMKAFPERDIEAEEARERFLKKFMKAFETLTPKQKGVISALQECGTQEKAAEKLGIGQPAISRILDQIQKKITKAIHNMPDSEQLLEDL